MAVVRSPQALRCSREQNALHTFIHQRHPTPSCGGHVPTAERTLDPARIFTESLTPGPELENSLGQQYALRDDKGDGSIVPKAAIAGQFRPLIVFVRRSDLAAEDDVIDGGVYQHQREDE